MSVLQVIYIKAALQRSVNPDAAADRRARLLPGGGVEAPVREPIIVDNFNNVYDIVGVEINTI
jgi:hypothetical protein